MGACPCPLILLLMGSPTPCLRLTLTSQVLYPGTHDGDEPAYGSVSVAVEPATGAVLCFGQSFKFNRDRAAQPGRHGGDARCWLRPDP